MGKQPSHVTRQSKLLFVFEVERDIAIPPKWLRVCISIPGREGTLSRVFTTDSDRVTTSDIQNLILWIDETVVNGLMSTEGIQGQLISEAVARITE